MRSKQIDLGILSGYSGIEDNIQSSRANDGPDDLPTNRI